MTAHDQLKRIQRPYTVAAWSSVAVFAAAGIGMMVVDARGIDGDHPYAFLIGAIGIIYLGSALLVVASTVAPLFRIRCPYCKARLAAGWKRWRYCPQCGGDFHTHVVL